MGRGLERALKLLKDACEAIEDEVTENDFCTDDTNTLKEIQSRMIDLDTAVGDLSDIIMDFVWHSVQK